MFFVLGAELRLDWMERELGRVRSATRMQRWALQAVREDAFKARRQRPLTTNRGAEPVVAVERFLQDDAVGARRLDTFLRFGCEDEPDLAGLALAVRQLGTLVS